MNETVGRDEFSFMELLLCILLNLVVPLFIPFILLCALGKALVDGAVWLYENELRKPNPGSSESRDPRRSRR